jgi:DUF4097 and DUF4098 domain-containing protein YvlB
MFRRMFAASLPIIALLFAAIMTSAAFGQERNDDDWCSEQRWDRDRDSFCEVRETTLAPGALSVDGGNNGGISVEAWDGSDILVRARVVAQTERDGQAQGIAEAVHVETAGNRVRAEGPDTGRNENWHVSYRIYVPRNTDLDLAAHNGGLSIDGVDGRIRFQTQNGGVHLRRVAGDVRGGTQNGGLKVELHGERWDGEGLDVSTHNGGVNLSIPSDYNAELETGTHNGGLRVDFPVTVSGEINRSLRTTLGDGGPPVKITTHNGGVRIGRNI